MRRRMQLAGAVALVALLGVVGAAIAGGENSRFSERLSGYQEVPALSTPGNGEFKAAIDRSEDEIRYRLSFRDTETTVMQAHIHLEQRSNNGGIMVFLCSNLGNGPAGTPACPAEGTVRGTLGPEDVVGPASQGIALGEFDEVVDAMRAGATYANVHTTGRPGGEIRGQLDGDHDHDRDHDRD